MHRSFFLIAAAATLILSACTADLEENCITGPCQADQSVAASTTGTGGAEGTGGTGGAGGGPDCSGVPATGEFPCDVFNVLATHCHECHTEPPLTVPFSLLQFEKTREIYGGKPIWQKMQEAIKSGFMPLGKPDLMGSDLKTMEDWFAACAQPVPDGMGCETP